jgi:hypothetical protein
MSTSQPVPGSVRPTRVAWNPGADVESDPARE